MRAAAKKRKNKKKKKGGPVVVARSEWTNLPGGVGGSLVYHPNEPVAYKTLGKRSEMPATVSLSVDLLKGFQQGKSKGEKVGRTKGKIQIKLRR